MFLGVVLLTPAARGATVERAMDGDSLLLSDGSQVRLIGVNTPELGRSCGPASRSQSQRGHASPACEPTPEQPLARSAQRRTAGLVEGKRVRLELGRETHDRHGRALAHVHIGHTNLEELLLREGLGWQVAIPPNVSHAARLKAAEDEARIARKGVWGEAAYRPIPVDEIDTRHTGFHMVTGQVRAVRQTPRSVVLELSSRFSVTIDNEHWRDYFLTDARFAGGPKALTGQSFRVRGWITKHNDAWRVRIGHPAMLD